MFKKMRRFKQQLSQEKCIEILTNEPHGVLSLISDTGYPYGFPITHWYDEKNAGRCVHAPARADFCVQRRSAARRRVLRPEGYGFHALHRTEALRVF